GSITSFFDKKNAAEFAAGADPAPLFSLHWVNANGQTNVLLSTEAQTVSRQGAFAATNELLLAFHYAQPSAEVLCRARLRETAPRLLWKIEVRFADSQTLGEIRFPAMRVRLPAESNPRFVVGSTKGGILKAEHFAKQSSWNWQQPGTLASPFAFYYNERSGFYFASQDPNGVPKQIEATFARSGLEISFHHLCHAHKELLPGYELSMDCLASDGNEVLDWRHGADLYKSWAEKQIWCAQKISDRKDLPRWMKSGPAFVQFDGAMSGPSNREWLADPEAVLRWFELDWKKNYPASTPLLVGLWGWEKVGPWVGGNYFPVYPSDEVFTSLVKKLRSRGGHLSLWPSGYNWALTYLKNPDGTFYFEDRKSFAPYQKHAVIEPNGELRVRRPSWLKGGELSQLCPGEKETRDWFDKQVGRPLSQRGVEMIQVDQMVGGRFPFCYAEGHAHPQGPGPWMTEVFARQLVSL
ncbi:MAG: hypothetical protein JNM63_17855, partial [Spirochaetia bacterium]|nr:hypothetical protein [Spirochaetia bacterium]